jgi:hypothetical protein
VRELTVGAPELHGQQHSRHGSASRVLPRPMEQWGAPHRHGCPEPSTTRGGSRAPHPRRCCAVRSIGVEWICSLVVFRGARPPPS